MPNHVAIIMDGNGRWAQGQGLSRLDGHHAGAENIRCVVEGFYEYGIQYLTLYAFSTENWNRPKKETQYLFHILGELIDREVKNLHERGVQLRHLGRLDPLSKQLQAKVLRAIELTKNNQNMTLSVAFNYGGRSEILHAVRRIIEDGIPAREIDETLFNQYLDTAGLPEPDLIIRTGGEMRLSNFLMWQSAYSECYFTPIPWPDFDKEEIVKVLQDYSRRERRFGGIRPRRGRRAKGDT